MRRLSIVAAVLLGVVFAVPVASSAAPTPQPTGPTSLNDIVNSILNTLAGTGTGTNTGTGGSAGTPVTGDTTQQIVVTAPQASSTTATLTAFEKGADGAWKPVVGPVKAFLGSDGMGQPQDNVPRTPQGTFGFDQAFGRLPNPGTKMPYFQATNQDWWDANPKSPTYNTHVHQAASPGGDSENIYDSGSVYDYAVNIAHNPQRIPGKAAGIFLHVTNNQPTQGCVAVDLASMKSILQWLDPAKNPKITIGVNASAPTNAPTTSAPTNTAPSGASPADTSPTANTENGLVGTLVDGMLSLLPTLLNAGSSMINGATGATAN
jgi:L,D-peptidoglycan transpeptidase YkuD (ErfK/YbiS/YcfS/YnhG family)